MKNPEIEMLSYNDLSPDVQKKMFAHVLRQLESEYSLMGISNPDPVWKAEQATKRVNRLSYAFLEHHYFWFELTLI